MKKTRNILIGFMAMAVIIAGIVLMPKTASAAEEVVNGSNEIIYVKDTEKLDIQEYLTKGKAPVREGYVFAGWYSEASEGKALSKTDAATAETAWAKFVPDYVLSVRAQIEDTTRSGDGATSIRVLSSVDSADYLNVGFDIWLANKTQLTMKNDDNETVSPLITDKAYRNIMVGEKEVSATATFGDVSKYFVVWRLDNIADLNDSKIIYVRPYWITMDGTKVEGLAKYVHVEDGYMGYVNVPVNLMTGEAIAAGIVEMEYQSGLTFVGFEEGRLLKEMEVNYGIGGVVKMVGNAENVNQKIYADGIYANLRFKKTGTADPNSLITTPDDAADFTNWDEDDVLISPVIQY